MITSIAYHVGINLILGRYSALVVGKQMNYKKLKSQIIFASFNTKTDKLLFHRAYIPEWKDIIPDTFLDKLTNQLVKDYNINK